MSFRNAGFERAILISQSGMNLDAETVAPLRDLAVVNGVNCGVCCLPITLHGAIFYRGAKPESALSHMGVRMRNSGVDTAALAEAAMKRHVFETAIINSGVDAGKCPKLFTMRNTRHVAPTSADAKQW